MSSNRFDMTTKTALVTGAASGIGRAVALELADAAPISCWPTSTALAAVADEVRYSDRRALSVGCDVSDHDQVRELAATALRECGKVDVLVNNAGICIAAPVADMTVEEWQRIERARAILGALEGAQEGAVMLDGEMIDEASRKRAEGLLARALAAGGRDAGAPP